MAGGTPEAADLRDPMSHGHPLVIALHRMAPVKGDKVILAAQHVQTCRGQLFDRHMAAALVYNLHAPSDHIVFRKHAVVQHCLHLLDPVLQHHFQCLRLIRIRIHCRQAFQ